MKKSPEQIKKQLIAIYLSGLVKKYDDISGQEQFTIFEKLPLNTQVDILNSFELNEGEVVVLTLFSKDCIILNTTERFIKLNGVLDEVYYIDFDGHEGYTAHKVMVKDGNLVSIKTEGYFQDFELKLKDGGLKKWIIPSGSSFWSITKKCEFIGRKYIMPYQA